MASSSLPFSESKPEFYRFLLTRITIHLVRDYKSSVPTPKFRHVGIYFSARQKSFSTLGNFPFHVWKTIFPRLENQLSMSGKLFFDTSEVVWDPEKIGIVNKEEV